MGAMMILEETPMRSRKLMMTKTQMNKTRKAFTANVPCRGRVPFSPALPLSSSKVALAGFILTSSSALLFSVIQNISCCLALFAYREETE